jgi:flavin-dependent dehydrogenase
LFEKEQYPFHRVCGEYISMESWDFLQDLGLDLQSLNVSKITELEVSSANGKLLKLKLPLGGFGISRYKLDHVLAQKAKECGVVLIENTKVNEIVFTGNDFRIETSKRNFYSKVAAACFGKRSNLDVKWQRPFIASKKNKLSNYVGVKYHIHSDFPSDSIALHNFKNGYCGIVKVEDDKYCLCYLTTAANLHNAGGDIKKMEKDILSKNKYLEKIFNESEIVTDAITISQISFDKKTQVEDHVLMIGDAAGMITPLCGNGMSMALHASKLAAEQILLFLNGDITRNMMEKNYVSKWRRLFSSRLRTGRFIQNMFGNEWLISSIISLGNLFPGLIKKLIRQTHGKSF